MIIKSVSLKNIRSYLDEQIDFPRGNVLLSGDIGSGKSTILLAIEFALFGIRRNYLSGQSLLRHGKNNGSIEVKFELEGNDITIKRTLKRSRNGVRQESGYIITNNKKKEGTHIELKASVLEMLGYPKELLTKTKDLIYRYTVYTPQEEMKQILLEDKEIRLNTLRKVFQIDKYKRIRENCLIFVRDMKEKIRQYEGMLVNLDEKNKQLKERKYEGNELKIKLDNLKPLLEKEKEKIKHTREKIGSFERKIQILNDLKNKREMKDVELRNIIEQRNRNKEEIERLEKDIGNLEKEIKSKEYKDVRRFIESKKNEIILMEKTISEIVKKINKSTTMVEGSNEIKNKIGSLEKCPLCQQDVTEEHKKEVIDKENEKIRKLDEDIKLYSKHEKNAKEKLENLKKGLERLIEDAKEDEIRKLKIENLKEKYERITSLLKQQDEIKKDVGRINVEKSDLNKKIESLKDIESEYKKIRDIYEEEKEKEKELEVKAATIKKEKEGIDKIIKNLEEEIKRMHMVEEKKKKLSQLQNWLEEYFISLMSLMEKHVMSRIVAEFNEFFQEWFNILIEDENMNVRLDDEFSPVIEQNGYETEIENLSGGERTACALAYRLALNKVINDLVENIKTKNIIILDEPTDGFSTEQLDKLRDVIQQLKMDQIIIVSHEEKIESFVNNIIRINKEEHVSTIA